MKDSLKKFFSVANLVGDNKYFCEKCKKKVEAKKSYVIDKSRFTPYNPIGPDCLYF